MAARSSAATMRRVSLRNLAAHKIRLVLTVLAVVLGTAFIAGSLMFTSSLQKTFDTLTESTTRGIDVVVSAPQSGSSLPLDLGDDLAGIPGVDKVNLSDQVTVVVATEKDGTQETLQTGGAPAFAMPWYEPDDAVGPRPALSTAPRRADPTRSPSTAPLPSPTTSPSGRNSPSWTPPAATRSPSPASTTSTSTAVDSLA